MREEEKNKGLSDAENEKGNEMQCQDTKITFSSYQVTTFVP